MRNRGSGFTLIELMIVIVIIGIITAVAIPNFSRMQERAREASVMSNMHALQVAVADFSSQANGNYPIDLAQTVSQADPGVPNNNNSVAGEEPANGPLGVGALLPGIIRNPISPANNTAQTEHPAPAWDQSHIGSCSIDFLDEDGNKAIGSPSNAKGYIISGYGKRDKLPQVLQSGK